MKLSNLRRIINQPDNTKILMSLAKEDETFLVLFRLLFSDQTNGTVKLQVLATSSPYDMPPNSLFYYTLDGRYLVRIRDNSLYRSDLLINAIHSFDSTDCLPVFRQIDNPLFLVEFNPRFTLSKEFRSELLGYVFQMGGNYNKTSETICFLEPRSDLYQYLEEGKTHESKPSNPTDPADRPAVPSVQDKNNHLPKKEQAQERRAP